MHSFETRRGKYRPPLFFSLVGSMSGWKMILCENNLRMKAIFFFYGIFFTYLAIKSYLKNSGRNNIFYEKNLKIK